MNWKKTAEHGAPKAKTAGKGKFRTMQVSDQFLCFDGESIFEIHLAFEDGDDVQWFIRNVTQYIRFSDIPKPKP